MERYYACCYGLQLRVRNESRKKKKTFVMPCCHAHGAPLQIPFSSQFPHPSLAFHHSASKFQPAAPRARQKKKQDNKRNMAAQLRNRAINEGCFSSDSRAAQVKARQTGVQFSDASSRKPITSLILYCNTWSHAVSLWNQLTYRPTNRAKLRVSRGGGFNVGHAVARSQEHFPIVDAPRD